MHTYINYNNAALLHCPLGVTELSIEIEGLFLINKNKLEFFAYIFSPHLDTCIKEIFSQPSNLKHNVLIYRGSEKNKSLRSTCTECTQL